MNFKWYISTFFLTVAILFGAFQEQVYIPNQEIVLEFNNTELKEENIEYTINEIKEKLLSTGASNIIVNEGKNGSLKIAYFSTVAIENIKELLSEKTNNLLGKTSDKKEKKDNSATYQFDIYELAENTDFSSSTNKSILNTKYSSNRFSTNNSNAFIVQIDLEAEDILFKIRYNTLKNNPFTKDKPSYSEPEVRAGPERINC